MKKEDIITLANLGCRLNLMKEIDEDKKYCRYILERRKPAGEIRIKEAQARKLLGDTAFLSGVRRAVLSQDTAREKVNTPLGNFSVHFDLWSWYQPKRMTNVKKTIDPKMVDDMILLKHLEEEEKKLNKEIVKLHKEDLPFEEEDAIVECDRVTAMIKRIKDSYLKAD